MFYLMVLISIILVLVAIGFIVLGVKLFSNTCGQTENKPNSCSMSVNSAPGMEKYKYTYKNIKDKT